MRARLDQLTRRGTAAGIVALVAAVTLAACGGSSASSSAPAASSSSGSVSSSSASASSSAAGGSAALGRQVFTSAGCGSCHTLAAARASGTVGPDLDQLKPSYSAVVAQVTNGGGAMPAFSGQLSKAQIADVARFVSTAATQ